MSRSIIVIPWILAFVTAVWFGFLAVRAGKSWLLWGLAGGLFGLVSTTFIFGLGHAASIPFTDQQRGAFHVEWTLVAIALILIVGGLFTWGMWHKSGPAQTNPPEAAAGGKPGRNAT